MIEVAKEKIGRVVLSARIVEIQGDQVLLQSGIPMGEQPLGINVTLPLETVNAEMQAAHERDAVENDYVMLRVELPWVPEVPIEAPA